MSIPTVNLVPIPELMLRSAQTLAEDLHAGAVDKRGEPHINHPARVVKRVSSLEEQTVAWLHDVVEDCDITLDELRDRGYTDAVIDALDAITHRPNEPRAEYYQRVLINPTARVVKLADIADNTDPRRLNHLPLTEAVRLMQKYAQALDVLTGPLGEAR